MKITTVRLVESSEWDRVVRDTYGRPYCLQQQDGCKERGIVSVTVPGPQDDFSNDTVPEELNHPDMGVSFKAWLERDPQKQLQNRNDGYSANMWWERNFYPRLQMVANDLCARGVLEAGEYVINIDW